MSKPYKIVHTDTIPPVDCPCGAARRAFASDPDQIATFHIVDIRADSQTHYHREHTEIYYVLEGRGTIELDGETHPLNPATSVLIKPGCRHRAVGQLKIINVCIPAFDPQDEWFD